MPLPNSDNEIKRGWKYILTAAVGLGCGSAALPLYSIGALVVPLEESFHWTRTEIQTATLFSLTVGAFLAPFVGRLTEIVGTKALIIPGIFGVSTGFIFVAFLEGNLWYFYLSYAIIAIIGAGTSPVTWIPNQFDKKRGLALGLALSGTGLCAILAPLFTVLLVDLKGWKFAYIGLGLIPLILSLPLCFYTIQQREQRNINPKTRMTT